MLKKLCALVANVVAAAGLALSPLAHAADYPEQPVRVIIGNPPGGPTDVFARALAARLTDELKQQFFVDNKAGASEILAAQVVANAKPDGYTLLFCTETPLAINQFTFSKLSYNPEKDFAPITMIASAPLVLVAPASSPVKSLDEFVALARSRAATKPLTYGSAGVGGVLHLPMAMLAKNNGLELTHVPYKGATPMLQDLLSGQIDAGWVGVSGAVPYVREGKLKALVVGGTSRLSILPNTPVFSETSIAPERSDFMFSLVAPAGTPPQILDKIGQAVKKIVNDRKFKETQLDPYGYVAVGSTPEDFRKFLIKDRQVQEQRIKVSGVRPE
ncbi:tripartite tricarboxylate transporter substrate binding protein [Ramlibacter sp. 2FC]|uniref:Bug family tripartite tricarboxylate transporter substrate binding protein n=1 Tax=Ramlibacter sp. 2FC TaxID=2502188 RepID=UPI0010F6CA99|nr:tripartite tricarboxylate transporter substrate binding protein [Ramlibacter sp. 2FC]